MRAQELSGVGHNVYLFLLLKKILYLRILISYQYDTYSDKIKLIRINDRRPRL